MAKTYRVGIAGLDHWYAALAAAEMAQKNPKTELTVLAHRNAGQLQETARRFGVASTTASYREVVERDARQSRRRTRVLRERKEVGSHCRYSSSVGGGTTASPTRAMASSQSGG